MAARSEPAGEIGAAAGGRITALTPNPAEARRILAPAGRLRVALFRGGVGADLGRELARRLRVSFEPVLFERHSEIIQAMTSARVDAVFGNAAPERMKDVVFSQPYVRVELGYLARAGSPIAGIEAVDKPGVFVAVLAGGTADSVLSESLKQAQIVRAGSLAEGVELLRSAQADLLASQKPALLQIADQVPGSRLLEGNFGIEDHAIGIPKDRSRALPFLREFIDDATQKGLLRDAIQR